MKNSLINLNKDKIKLLCKSYKVKSLYSFGSINTSAFNELSDIDLLVEIDSDDPLDYSDNYFELKFDLEKMFNRSIDLLENKTLKNKYLKENIDSSKVLIYGK
ncbi:MAG: nucleotidyltransferase domain-containing protein [Ignavibacteria bacterium]|nr:nucleotidyltransferase domain-containing protein [Ignavibacteria bacterium]MBK9331928.1 nucleotidyltransferase domain-containing protein [Ignavibacteria bacterium]